MKNLFILNLAILAVSVWGIKKEEFPNPIQTPSQCWRYKQDADIPANLKICDPDNLILPQDARKLQTSIERIKTSTQCPCRSDRCHIWRLSGTNSGYAVSLVLVRSMSSSAPNVIDSAREYASYLRTNRNYYGYSFARCEEDVIIFLSFDDKVVYILTGSTARQKLADDFLESVISDSQESFKKGVYDGLQYILDEISEKLGVQKL